MKNEKEKINFMKEKMGENLNLISGSKKRMREEHTEIQKELNSSGKKGSAKKNIINNPNSDNKKKII